MRAFCFRRFTYFEAARDQYLYGLDLVGQHPDGENPGYYYRDHLGSVRVTKGQYGAMWSADDYYPYGLQMPGRSYVSSYPGTKDNFTGHELDDETGLLYAGARYYGAALARWGRVDPLGEKYAAWSPYNYVLGNPLGLVDPEGATPLCPNCIAQLITQTVRSASTAIRNYFDYSTSDSQKNNRAIADGKAINNMADAGVKVIQEEM